MKIAALSFLEERSRDQHGVQPPNLLLLDPPAAHAAGRLPAIAKRISLQRMLSLIPLDRMTSVASISLTDGDVCRNDRDGTGGLVSPLMNRMEALRA